MRRYALIVVLLLGVTLLALALIGNRRGGTIGASAVAYPVVDTSQTGFERAVEPRDWTFPADHGPHPSFQTEWWYYTGNLATASGRRFGYQFTIFRRAITPDAPVSESEWRTNQIYLAHFTVTDVEGEAFSHEQRISRAADGLAGATVDPLYRVWLEDWQASARDEEAVVTRIAAASNGVAIDLSLEQVKPPALQGDGGLSPKSDTPGNASYYYSLTRLVTDGTVTVGGQAYSVSGASWMDHEFSTSALAEGAVGWDWFGLHLDGNWELMLGQIRLRDGGVEPSFGGLLVFPDGSTQSLSSSDFSITTTDTWTSPHTGATYPAGWEIRVNTGGVDSLDLTLTPLLEDQELTGEISYWEGAVRISGDAEGYGYAELTGYTAPMQGRF